ncbi:MAG: CBS domain-containing protein [Vicinamibacterales bacterium]
MTPNRACCTPATTLRDVARMMLEHNCGEIPVIETAGERRLIGVITDRDIVCRGVARGHDPNEATAASCMSQPPVTVTTDTSLTECCQIMEAHQIRRVPVVDQRGACCGIVAQADIAARASAEDTADLVRKVSEEEHSSPRIH